MIEHKGIFNITDGVLQESFPEFYPRLKAGCNDFGWCEDTALLEELHNLLLLPPSYTLHYAEIDPEFPMRWHLKVESIDIPPTDTSDFSARYPEVVPLYSVTINEQDNSRVVTLNKIEFRSHTS